MNARPRSIATVGGGPAGLYLAILLKREDPSRRVTVFERNRADDTFGFGVIFSDATLDTFAQADPASSAAMREASVHWDDLDVFVRGERVTSTGHGFAGLERKRMLSILQARAAALGVELRFREEPILDVLVAEHDLVVAADGVNSAIRERYAADFSPTIDLRPNRFIWLGSTQPLSAFTFYFDRNQHGLFRVHAYRYDRTASTFIVECTAETFARTGLDPADEAGAVRYCEALFAHRLDGHRLLSSHSTWRRFPTIKNRRWHRDKLVLVGDAAHTAHFSIGSGTKLAIEDAIALAAAIEREPTLGAALDAYERDRQPAVARLQRAAETSLAWFETTERYFDRLDPLSFTYSLLTRSLRLDHENLALRDPALIARVDAAFAERAGAPGARAPIDAPLRLRGLVLPNRLAVASPTPLAGAGLALLRSIDHVAAWRGAATIGLRLGADADAPAIARRALDAGVELLELDGPSPELVEAVRAGWPADRPLCARLVGGDDLVERARALAARGCDLIDVGGEGAGRLHGVPASERVRLDAGVPTMVSGGIRSAGDANAVLAAGRADLCLLDAAELSLVVAHATPNA